jgi:cell fate (sporulation/competence/biofilm development) regulator YmcA (YheA/YmcA/DUF963 family)
MAAREMMNATELETLQEKLTAFSEATVNLKKYIAAYKAVHEKLSEAISEIDADVEQLDKFSDYLNDSNDLLEVTTFDDVPEIVDETITGLKKILAMKTIDDVSLEDSYGL